MNVRLILICHHFLCLDKCTGSVKRINVMYMALLYATSPSSLCEGRKTGIIIILLLVSLEGQ